VVVAVLLVSLATEGEVDRAKIVVGIIIVEVPPVFVFNTFLLVILLFLFLLMFLLMFLLLFLLMFILLLPLLYLLRNPRRPAVFFCCHNRRGKGRSHGGCRSAKNELS